MIENSIKLFMIFWLWFLKVIFLYQTKSSEKWGENDLIKIYYSPKFSEAVNIEIYNLRGQKIRTIKAAENESYVQWNGKDADNKFVSEGVYFYKILNKSANICGKITLMK